MDADHGCVYVRFGGKLTLNQMGRYTDALRKDRAFELTCAPWKKSKSTRRRP